MFIEKSDNPVQPFKSTPYMRVALVICVAGIFAVGFASGIFEIIREISFTFLN